MFKKIAKGGLFNQVMLFLFLLFSVVCTPIGVVHLMYSVKGMAYNGAFIFLGGFCPFFVWVCWVRICKRYDDLLVLERVG